MRSLVSSRLYPKRRSLSGIVAAGALLLALRCSAALLYVDANNPSPAPPFGSWATAARTIQEAVDAAGAADVVVVTNGLYRTGSRVIHGALANRLAVTKPLTVRSVNGPEATVIEGVPGSSDAAVRCVYLTNGAALLGFALTNGGTRAEGDMGQECSGGALWGESTSAVASNCWLLSSSSQSWGGGALHVTLLDCVLGANASGHGGGAFECVLTNCVLTNNFAYLGGGARDSILDHCTVRDNTGWDVGGGVLGGTSIRCIFSGNSAHNAAGGGAYGAVLDHCNLAANSAGTGGGGANDSVLNYCQLIQNSAAAGGGGASFSTLSNCVLALNSAGHGGAAWYGTLVNCTVVSNSAPVGGGAEQSVLKNCIVYYNLAGSEANYTGSTLDYCCTEPLPPSGTGNIAAEPRLKDLSHIAADSPCRGAGNVEWATDTDLEGEPWAIPPSIGCDEYYATPATNALVLLLRARYTNLVTGFSGHFLGRISGRATAWVWDLGDGTTVSNRLEVSQAWRVPGDYQVQFRAYNEFNPGGVAATTMVHVVTQPVHYVSPHSPTPVSPFSSWTTAATNLQDAVDAVQVAGALVLVTNGIYRTGGAALPGALSNRLAVTRAMTVQSVQGPRATLIEGYKVPGTVTGDAAVRCAFLAEDVILSGFTLTNGATRAVGDPVADRSGGGALCESAGAVLTNCILVANQAWEVGGGVRNGTLQACVLADNRVAPGNPDGSVAGAVDAGFLNNCLLTRNQAGYGGGAANSVLVNCTVAGNSATYFGGGTYLCTLTNSIVYFNTAPAAENATDSDALSFCCTWPLPASGTGNVTNAPGFEDRALDNLRLQAGSPCIGTGETSSAPGATDLDGRPRLVGGGVDMGAYEFQSSALNRFIPWLQANGLPSDGTADVSDPDGDRMNNWQEWWCGTDPNRAGSALRLVSVSGTLPAITLTWESVTNRTYVVERATSLAGAPGFVTIATGIVGQPERTSYTDTTAPGPGPFFYRIGVP